MEDKFHALTIREAIAVQIFYSSPDDENLHGKMLNGKSWFEPVGEVVDVTFRESDVKKDEALEKLVKERAYAQILKQYNKPGATYKIV